jgi:hypothetical protein
MRRATERGDGAAFLVFVCFLEPFPLMNEVVLVEFGPPHTSGDRALLVVAAFSCSECASVHSCCPALVCAGNALIWVGLYMRRPHRASSVLRGALMLASPAVACGGETSKRLRISRGGKV